MNGIFIIIIVMTCIFMVRLFQHVTSAVRLLYQLYARCVCIYLLDRMPTPLATWLYVCSMCVLSAYDECILNLE